MVSQEVEIHVNTQELDEAIQKANRLCELLREASHIIDSLSGRMAKKGLKRPPQFRGKMIAPHADATHTDKELVPIAVRILCELKSMNLRVRDIKALAKILDELAEEISLVE